MAKEKNEILETKKQDNFLDFQNRKIELAKERGAYVCVPQSPEASTVALMINTIDFVFRESRNPKTRMSIKDTQKSIEATIKFKEALITFSDAICEISKLKNRDYKEQAIIKLARKEIEDDKKYLENFPKA